MGVGEVGAGAGGGAGGVPLLSPGSTLTRTKLSWSGKYWCPAGSCLSTCKSEPISASHLPTFPLAPPTFPPHRDRRLLTGCLLLLSALVLALAFFSHPSNPSPTCPGAPAHRNSVQQQRRIWPEPGLWSFEVVALCNGFHRIPFFSRGQHSRKEASPSTSTPPSLLLL